MSQQPFPFNHEAFAPIERLKGGGTRVICEGEGRTVAGSLSSIVALACLLALVCTPVVMHYRPILAPVMLLVTLGVLAVFENFIRPMLAVILERQLIIKATPEGVELRVRFKNGRESRLRFWPAEQVRTFDASGTEIRLKLQNRRSVTLATLGRQAAPERVVLALKLGLMRCFKCRYDLRAGHVLCPECGTLAPPQMFPSSPRAEPIMPTVE